MMNTLAETNQQDGWKRLLSSASQTPIQDLENASTLRQLHRKAYGKFYSNQMDPRTFFLISCVSWMESCNWFESDPQTGRSAANLQAVVSFISRTSCMASWMIPHITNVPNLGRVFDPKQAWINFWMAYYDQCNDTVESAPPKAKRMRLATTSYNTTQETKHGLSCAFLMVALLYAQQAPESWDQFHGS